MTSWFFPNHGAILNAGFFASAETTNRNHRSQQKSWWQYGGNTATWCYLLEWWILGFPGSHNATNFYFPIEWQFQLNLISLSFGLRVWQLPKVPCIEIMRRHSWRHKFGFVSSGYANAAILRYSMLPQVKMGHMMISHGVWGPQLWDIPRWT